MAHLYKSYKFYRVIVLNMLAHTLNVNIYQEGIEEKLDLIIQDAKYEITKSEIRHEIRSNHKMTEKVLGELEKEGLIKIESEGKKSLVKITKKGVLHLIQWNRFYMQLYREQIKDHYRYVGLPAWFMEGDQV